MEAFRLRKGIPGPVDPVEANALRGGRMSLRDSFIVGMQTLISNSCGASVGLEAGYAQVGSGLGSFLGQKLRLRRSDLRLLVGAGAAAAIGGSFGAPLTGAFYAFEVVLGSYSIAGARGRSSPPRSSAFSSPISCRRALSDQRRLRSIR